MTVVHRLVVFRCNVRDDWNPNGCPVESDPLVGWNAAKAEGWTGTQRESRCPEHAERASLSDRNETGS